MRCTAPNASNIYISPSFNKSFTNFIACFLSSPSNSSISFFSHGQFLTFSITNISFSFNPCAAFIAFSLTPSLFIESSTKFILSAYSGNHFFNSSHNSRVDSFTFTSVPSGAFIFGSKCINNTNPLLPFWLNTCFIDGKLSIIRAGSFTLNFISLISVIILYVPSFSSFQSILLVTFIGTFKSARITGRLPLTSACVMSGSSILNSSSRLYFSTDLFILYPPITQIALKKLYTIRLKIGLLILITYNSI